MKWAVTSRESTKILLKPPFESASVKSTRWPRKLTSKDDYQVPMTAGCKRYSTEHAEGLRRAQTVLARLNLVSITVLEKLKCLVSTNVTSRNSRILSTITEG